MRGVNSSSDGGMGKIGHDNSQESDWQYATQNEGSDWGEGWADKVLGLIL